MTHLTLMGLTGSAAGSECGGWGSELLPRFATAHLFRLPIKELRSNGDYFPIE